MKNFKIKLMKIHTLEEALKHLKKFFEKNKGDWIPLNDLIINNNDEPLIQKSNIAAHFAASLELAKAGIIKLRQYAPFAPIYIKNITKLK